MTALVFVAGPPLELEGAGHGGHDHGCSARCTDLSCNPPWAWLHPLLNYKQCSVVPVSVDTCMLHGKPVKHHRTRLCRDYDSWNSQVSVTPVSHQRYVTAGQIFGYVLHKTWLGRFSTLHGSPCCPPVRRCVCGLLRPKLAVRGRQTPPSRTRVLTVAGQGTARLWMCSLFKRYIYC